MTPADLRRLQVVAEVLHTRIRVADPEELNDWYYQQCPTEEERRAVTWILAAALSSVQRPFSELTQWTYTDPPRAVQRRRAVIAGKAGAP